MRSSAGGLGSRKSTSAYARGRMSNNTAAAATTAATAAGGTATKAKGTLGSANSKTTTGSSSGPETAAAAAAAAGETTTTRDRGGSSSSSSSTSAAAAQQQQQRPQQQPPPPSSQSKPQPPLRTATKRAAAKKAGAFASQQRATSSSSSNANSNANTQQPPPHPPSGATNQSQRSTNSSQQPIPPHSNTTTTTTSLGSSQHQRNTAAASSSFQSPMSAPPSNSNSNNKNSNSDSKTGNGGTSNTTGTGKSKQQQQQQQSRNSFPPKSQATSTNTSTTSNSNSTKNSLGNTAKRQKQQSNSSSLAAAGGGGGAARATSMNASGSTNKTSTSAVSSSGAPLSQGTGSAAAASAGASASSHNQHNNNNNTNNHVHDPDNNAGMPDEKVTMELLSQCDWMDKTLWVSRQLLGGQSVNGFLRATATVQRIKKQRARQTAKTQHHQQQQQQVNAKDHSSTNTGNTAQAAANDEASVATAGSNNNNNNPNNNNNKGDGDAKDAASKKRDASDQAAEEVLKAQIMNARTAKKFKTELEMGLSFCALLHNTVRSILQELDVPATGNGGGPSIPPPLGPELPHDEEDDNKVTASAPPKALRSISGVPTTAAALPPAVPTSLQSSSAVTKPIPAASVSGLPATAPTSSTSMAASMTGSNVKPPPGPGSASPLHRMSPSADSTATAADAQGQTTASAGNPNGSTLRRYRKKKLPPSNEPQVQLSEFDASGKRIFSKKEHTYRVFEVVRFRALKQGDYVAARVSSRDLWILARVVKEFPAANMTPLDFLQLSEARRDQMFKDKVLVKDVEDGGSSLVARNLVLPLPRSFSEAAEWGHRYRKGSRVYAMYPHTTSLYTATVVDCTTYCRDDDDIIVVEFDGDEPDETGSIPKCHIPARFVTLIPREFPGAQPQSASRASRRNSDLTTTINPAINGPAGGTSATEALPPLATTSTAAGRGSPALSATEAGQSSKIPTSTTPMSDDLLMNGLDDMGFEGMGAFDELEDLDFDLGLGTED